MEPKDTSKHKTAMRTRNIVILVLISILLLSTLIYLTIPLASSRIDNNQPDQALVPVFQDQTPEGANRVSSSDVKPGQNPVVQQKQPNLIENRYNLTGRWLTDENLEWKIVQSGDEVEITRYNKRGNPTIVQGRINGNTLSYRKSKAGNDLEGKFTISKDGNGLDGIEYKIAGIRNRLKITRIP